jgi:hypothetical protein
VRSYAAEQMRIVQPGSDRKDLLAHERGLTQRASKIVDAAASALMVLDKPSHRVRVGLNCA